MENPKKMRNGITSKTMKKKGKTTACINTLPQDAIVEIVAQLVSHSPRPFADLYNLKTSCKTFFAASKDKMVKQQIAVDKEISILIWTATDRYMAILDSCANAENVEANFILALINIFKLTDFCRGVELLKKATHKGHEAAVYMMNILRVRLKKHHISVDMNSHNDLKIEQSTYDDYDQLKWCREKVLNVIRLTTWNKWQASAAGNIRQCENSGCGIVRGWDGRISCCSNACRWNNEYLELCREM